MTSVPSFEAVDNSSDESDVIKREELHVNSQRGKKGKTASFSHPVPSDLITQVTSDDKATESKGYLACGSCVTCFFHSAIDVTTDTETAEPESEVCKRQSTSSTEFGRAIQTSNIERGDYKTIPLAEHLVPNQQHGRKSNIKSIRAVLLEYGREADDRAKENAEDPEWMTGNGNKGSGRGNRIHVGQKTPVLGSSNCHVHTNGNYGFFSTILESYNNHWALRTSPEDWWYSIIYKIAIAIDQHSTNEKVRKFFVSHEGKKKLTVTVGPSIYGVDYAWFLDSMTRQIEENVKVPKYVDILKADFSTSTACHVICSEITIMASVQEFFEYGMMLLCGIPAVEMEGNLEDWKHLKHKFHILKKILKPIRECVGLAKKWWNDVSGVFDHLIDTFDGKPDTDWWSRIISKEPYGSGGQSFYEGWFITQFLGLRMIENPTHLQNGVITVPMTITDGVVKEQSAFVAGIAGYDVIEVAGSKWPSVKAIHGWTLMLDPQSHFREGLTECESKLVKGA